MRILAMAYVIREPIRRSQKRSGCYSVTWAASASRREGRQERPGDQMYILFVGMMFGWFLLFVAAIYSVRGVVAI